MGEPIYKVLDCQRKGILGLPSGAVHLWLTYWMHESEDNECYLSTRVLAAIMNVDRNTVMKWQQYLLANGWLKLTGGSAADKYDNPTRGASKVPTMRVDDPLKGCLAETMDHEEGEGVIQPESGGNLIGGKNQPKVSGSVSSSRCVTVRDTTPPVAIPMSSHAETFSLRSNDERQKQEQNQGQNQKQKQNQKQYPLRSESAVKPQLKQSPKYDSPFPAEFDSWSVLARAEWVEVHSVRNKPEPSFPVQRQEAPVPPTVNAEPVQPAKVQPPNAAPPPAPIRPKAAIVVAVAESAPVQDKEPAPELTHGLPEYEEGWANRIARDLYKLQAHYNPRFKPPRYWEIIWANESAPLVRLAIGDNPFFKRGWMLSEVIALSQVKYAARYTTPALIVANLSALWEEIASLKAEGTFDPIWKANKKVAWNEIDEEEEDKLKFA
jgi:hypothetical protein